MDSKIKADWLAALRSDKYKQTKGVLHRVENDEHSFCCLGVLCDILGLEWKHVKGTSKYGIAKYGIATGNNDFSINAYSLPGHVMEQIGISRPAPVYTEAVDMNDNSKTFHEIADHIEANL